MEDKDKRNRIAFYMASMVFMIFGIWFDTIGQVTMPVRFSSEGETLYGQIILPDTTGVHPLVIFLSGSGPSSSYRTNYAGFLAYFFESVLPEKGIALMYFDKRGVGKSTGKWYKTNFHERADDAMAAIDFVCSTGYIDPSRICIAGHSQGGWIAQIVAARYPEKVACMLSMSGATFGVYTQLVNDYQSELICKGIDSIRANQRAMRKASVTRMATRLFPVTENMIQLKRVINFDPSPEIRSIQCPALFTFAENDELVYPEWCMERLDGIFPGGIPDQMTSMVFPGTDHGYRISSFCTRENGKKGPESEIFRAYVTEWIIKQIGGRE